MTGPAAAWSPVWRAVAIFIGLGLITACGLVPDRSENADPTVPSSAQEANRRLLAALAETEKMLNRPFTTHRAGSGPEHCELPDGSDGHSFFMPGRDAKLDADPHKVVTQVETFWRAKELSVTSSTPGDDDLFEVVGRTPDGGVLTVYIGRKANVITIFGESGCAKAIGT